jgi:hypothetical protein
VEVVDFRFNFNTHHKVMVSSGHQTIVRILLLLGAIVSANAQTAVDKASTSTISGKVTLGGKGVSGLVVGLAIETPSSSTYVTQLKAVTDFKARDVRLWLLVKTKSPRTLTSH